MGVFYEEHQGWEAEDIMADHGPVFLIGNDNTAYNTMDAGNWWWGNANNRLEIVSNRLKDWQRFITAKIVMLI